MTKVLAKNRVLRLAVLWLVVCALSSSSVVAENPPGKPAETLYLELGQVGLDSSRVYQVRGASLNRPAVQISLEDGTIGFTQDVMGRVTGAFFEGDGEILLTPPSEVERRSMSLFTGMAILEERFATAYFRFNDDLATELAPDLRAADNAQAFVDHWGQTAKNLAQTDAMRLLVTFSRMLPGKEIQSAPQNLNLLGNIPDHLFHARLQGTKLGVFDVLIDSLASEQVEAGQERTGENGVPFYDVWTSFAPDTPRSEGKNVSSTSGPSNPSPREDWISARQFKIRAQVQPPKQLHADARVQLDVREGGTRALLFELSRFLQVQSVRLDDQPVEFIHNPAVEGTQLSRRGNDIVAVILPEPVRSGQKLEIEFLYGGEVLAEAASGLLYVGARGTWYPNRGMAMADFDLQFRYPQGWTLLATGEPREPLPEGAPAQPGEQVSRWVSDRPIPVAGFNLGKYRAATARAGSVTVQTYATGSVERDFPSPPIEVIGRRPSDPSPQAPRVIVPDRPSPMQHEVAVGESAAHAIQYFADRFGPFPFKHLALTQMPGPTSQGWPGLVFLSSYAFLDDQQRQQLHYEPYRILLQQLIPAHETAHQWWGDLITWSSYRDQWFSEGLANYCSLMMLQEKNPAGFRQVMEKYRRDLLEKNKDGSSPMEAGPVTLGTRLLSSRFPEGYEEISYGRGTWLFHMLRTMLSDTAPKKAYREQIVPTADEPFVQALRKVRERYEGKAITTKELLDVFAEDIPLSLRYEGKNSLDWFLNGWINGTSLPKLEIKSVRLTPRATGMIATGTILQKDAPQDLVTSVPIYAVTAGKQPFLLGRVFADGEESSFRLQAPAGTRKIVVDPYETVLTSPK